MTDRWRVRPGEGVRLAEVDTSSVEGAPGGKSQTKSVTGVLNDELRELQDKLWAEGERSLLVVLQAMDTGGKDGTIKHVFGGLIPQATRVASFKAPTPDELAHDFLWRIHAQTPAAGRTVVFNRSHYEDVVIVRIHKLVDEDVWRARYALINDFEETLARAGTTVVKLFLHISKAEQKQRLQERLDDPAKRWKFNAADVDERAFWDEYQRAYEDAINATSTKVAPWYVIPADRNWYRNWAVSSVLVDTLRRLDPKYPDPPDLDGVEIV
jgi:PPK2 family polyphosphate:nucleotide phosphotransferase